MKTFAKFPRKNLCDRFLFNLVVSFTGKSRVFFLKKLQRVLQTVVFTEQIRAGASVANILRDHVDPVNTQLKLNINKMYI